MKNLLKKIYNDKPFFYGLIVIAIYAFVNYVLIDYVIVPLVVTLMPRPDYSVNQITFFEKIDYSLWPTDFLIYYSNINIIINTLFYLFLAIPIIILSKKRIKEDLVLYKEDLGINASLSIFGILIFYGFEIGAAIVTQVLYLILGKEELTSVNQNSIEMVLNTTSINAIIMSFIAIIVGPIVEELVFRKAMFNVLKNKWVALFVSSAIFALIHNIGNGYAFGDLILVSLTYFGAGLGLGLIYIITKRNVLATICVHILANTISILIVLLGIL